MRVHRYFKNIFFVIIIDIVIFLSAEFFLRVVLKDSVFIDIARGHFDPITHLQPTNTQTYDLDPVVFWKLKPSRKYILKDIYTGESYFFYINPDGFRGEDYYFPIDKYDFRILALGGSSTIGWQVAKTYASTLEDLLSERYPDKNIIAINAGVDGYTSYQGLKFLEKNIDFLNPNLILVHFGHNDWSDALLNIEDKKLSYYKLW